MSAGPFPSSNTTSSLAMPPRVLSADAPTRDQSDPSQRAKWFALTAPACLNEPPTNTPGPPSALVASSDSTNGAGATPGSRPAPSADQLEPFQRAREFTGVPSTVAKFPPTRSSAPEPPSNTQNSATLPLMPEPTGDQFDPSQRAMRFAAFSPASVNGPP